MPTVPLLLVMLLLDPSESPRLTAEKLPVVSPVFPLVEMLQAVVVLARGLTILTPKAPLLLVELLLELFDE